MFGISSKFPLHTFITISDPNIFLIMCPNPVPDPHVISLRINLFSTIFIIIIVVIIIIIIKTIIIILMIREVESSGLKRCKAKVFPLPRVLNQPIIIIANISNIAIITVVTIIIIILHQFFRKSFFLSLFSPSYLGGRGVGVFDDLS